MKRAFFSAALAVARIALDEPATQLAINFFSLSYSRWLQGARMLAFLLRAARAWRHAMRSRSARPATHAYFFLASARAEADAVDAVSRQPETTVQEANDAFAQHRRGTVRGGRDGCHLTRIPTFIPCEQRGTGGGASSVLASPGSHQWSMSGRQRQLEGGARASRSQRQAP